MPILTAKERIGTEIGGRYKLEKIIGEGGFSSVFLAEHSLTGRKVALKILHAHLVQEEQIAQRFLLEAQSMAKLRHPGIVQVLDAGREADGTVFLALELLEGETLEDMLQRVTRLSRQEATKIALEVLGALAAAHNAQIVHRDIKPANIYLTNEEDGSRHSKLLDFGIAHVVPKGGGKLTSQGLILGTPEYMSPEQGRGTAIGPEADLWSVGIVMYEMFSGVVPWTHESSTVVLMTVAQAPLPDIRAFAPGLPEPFIAVIVRALQKDARDRYSSADEMRRALVDAARTVDGKTSAQFRAVALPPPRALSPTPHESKPSGLELQSTSAHPPPRTSMLPKPKTEFDFEGSEDGSSLEIDPTAEAMVRASRQDLPAQRPPPAPTPTLPAPPIPDDPVPQQQVAAAPRASVRPPSAPLSPRGPSGGSLTAPSEPLSPRGPSGASLRPPAEQLSPRGPSGASLRAPAMPSAPNDVSRTPPARGASGSYAAVRDTGPRAAVPPAPALEDDLPLPPPGPLTPTATHRTSRAPSPAPLPTTRTLLPVPRESNSVLTVVVPVALAAAALGAFALYRLRPTPGSSVARTHEDGASHADATREVAERHLESRVTIAVPYGIAGEDIHAFARHATAGERRDRGLRTIATCSRDTIYLYGSGDGLPTASGSAPIACDLPDIAVIADIDGDGASDVAAVARTHEGVLILATHQLTVRGAYAIPGVQALAGSFMLRGDPVVVAYVEPNGPGAATDLVAFAARTGAILWRSSARAPLLRLGHPLDLGLAIGPDANNDGVPDIVAGATVAPSLPIEQMPPRPRCVELISGSDGQRIWPEPFCQLRGGSQSTALGPDVDGDRYADVVIGSDVTRGADARVVIVSGRDGHLIRRVATPEGQFGTGFGWPVAIGPDVTGDNVADIAVGSVGSAGTHVTLISGATGDPEASVAIRGESGFPNLRLLFTQGLMRGDGPALLAAGPDDGLHVYVLGEPAL